MKKLSETKNYIIAASLDNKPVFAAFFLPVLIMVLAFAVTGIYPFGSNQIPIIDMYHQYIPFLSELQYKLQTGGSLLYSWNGAGGYNFWCLLAYYGASPLNLLLIFFPRSLIVEGVTTILLIKIGLAGSFMYTYLTAKRPAADWQAVGFACLYALSSYVLGYFWCIMWLDALAMLPLLILGLQRLVDEGRSVLYTVTLALIVYCNYYIAIMVCIFVLVYYPVLYFAKPRHRGARGCALITLNAVGYSLLGIAMSAVMLLPTYMSMQNAYYISSDWPSEIKFYHDPLDVLNQLLPEAQLTFREGLPNLYCGMAAVILVALYLTNRRIPVREKLVHGALLVFLYFSLNVNVLDYIWHGMHFPNQLPFRYSFMVCFLLLSLAYRSLQEIGGIGTRKMVVLAAGGCGYYLLAEKILKSNLDDANMYFYVGVAALIAFSTLFILYRNGKLNNRKFTALFLLLICLEMCCSTCSAFDKTGNTSRETYFENIRGIEKSADFINRQGFARTEIDDTYVLNAPALYHYKGLSQFSSSINSNYTTLMEEIGLEGSPAKNRANYNLTDPVTNAMLNVRYVIARNEALEDGDFKSIYKSGSTRVYENKYPLSIGYMVPDSIRTWDAFSANPFDNLNDYVRSVTGNEYENVFRYTAEPALEANNIECLNTGEGYYSTIPDNTSAESTVRLTYKADETCKYYVFVEADNARSITVEKEDITDNIDIREDSGSVVNIGKIKKGETFDIAIAFDAGDSGAITSHVATMDRQIWDAAYNMMSDEMMTVTDYGDSWLRGEITNKEKGILLTSIPYEKGWTLKIDGVERKTPETAGDLWISASLDAGSHQVELNFRPPGLIAGALITLLSVLLMILLHAGRRKLRLAGTPDADEPVYDVRDLI